MEPIDFNATDTESSDWDLDKYKALNDSALNDTATSLPNSRVLPASFSSYVSSDTGFHGSTLPSSLQPSSSNSRPNLPVGDEMLIYEVALQGLNQPTDETTLPDGLLSVSLFRHQKIALAWMLQKENSVACSGGFLADHQGLGKTISIIALIQIQKSSSKPKLEDPCVSRAEALDLDDDIDKGTIVVDEDKQAGESDEMKLITKVNSSSSTREFCNRKPLAGSLVVCPASLLRQWARELDEKVADEARLEVLMYHGGNRTKDPAELAKYDVVLTTYSIVAKEVPNKTFGEDGSTSSPLLFSSPLHRRRSLCDLTGRRRLHPVSPLALFPHLPQPSPCLHHASTSPIVFHSPSRLLPPSQLSRRRPSSKHNLRRQGEALRMDKRGEDAHDSPAKMEKKSDKSKNRTNDLVDDGDGDHYVEVDGGGLPKTKVHKHREKKSKSESNEDGDEDQLDEGNLEDDGDIRKKDKKKRKRDSSENNQPSEKTQIEENEQGHDNGPSVERDCDPKPRKEKRKHKHHSQERKLENNGIVSSVGTSKVEKVHDEVVDGEGTEISMEDCQEDMFEKIDKKKKKKKKTERQDSDAGITTEELGKEGSASQDGYLVDDESNTRDNKGSKRKKKSKYVEKDPEEHKAEDKAYSRDSKDSKGSKGKKKTTKSVENNTEKPKAKSKSKRVSFSGHVEIFPSSDTDTEKQKSKGDGLVRGKRFTPEEDAIVKEAVLNYIAAHDLGDEGLKMVLNCNSHPGMKKCWQEIGTCIPYRPYTAVYYRAHILFERSENRTWSPEEIEFLKEFHEKHGNNWKMVAEELGKHRFHVKDTWRRIKLKNLKGGQWSQEEYQSLYDLVNLDLQMKMSCEVKQSKHGMLRDNIPWTAISEKLSTRSDATCCTKWYNQLTSSLVAEKKWCDADDYRLIGELYKLDAACEEDVDWENLLPHRPGDICLKRWNQMVHHIGHHGSQPFAEQVDTLAKRYCPDLADTREAWDNKPVVS